MPEIIVANFSQTKEENRLDADFYREVLPSDGKIDYRKIGDKDIVPFVQYGISIDMNENAKGFRIYRMNEIENMFCSDLVSKYADISEEEMQKFRLQNNDVLFNRTNSFEFVGRTGIFKEFSSENIVFASYLIRLRTNEKLILPEYLTVFLNTKYGISEIRRRARISINQSNVSGSELKKIKIPILPMPFQTEIRNMVDGAFRKFTESKQAYKEAEKHFLGYTGLTGYKTEHFLTFQSTFKNSSKARRIDAEYFQPEYDFVLRKIEEVARKNHWEVRKIVDISEPLKYGSSEKFAYLNQGVPFLRITDIQSFDFDLESIHCISEEESEKAAHAKVEEGDLVISRSGTLGLAIPIGKELADSVFGSYFIRIRPKMEIDPIYLALYLNSVFGKIQVEQNSTGAIQTNLTIPAIENINVLIPEKNLQESVSSLVNKSKVLRQEAMSILKAAITKTEDEVEGNLQRNPFDC
jgi:type I restriction enzyme S subunit